MSDHTDARQLVIFSLSSERYALPIAHVHEIIRYAQPRSVASADTWVRGVINLRGEVIPIYDIAARLRVSSELSEHTKIVIVETETRTVGMIVDAVDEVLTVRSEHLEHVAIADRDLIDSIAKVGERLVVLINPDTIFPDLDAAAA